MASFLPMPNITNLVAPERPEGRASHLEQGFVIGWVPGEITSLDDPEKIGRVKVRCDLIHQDTDLPNANDGWVWVLEEFVANATPGGTHRLLKIGAQVALLPMLGDPRQMILLGCIPSRIDQPHPELDRSKEIHGVATPGQVFDMKNDADASRIQAYPNGVLQTISATGDITNQTAEHARTQLSADGTARIENDKSFTMMTPDGAVKQKSKDGAETTLTADGKVEVKSATESKLTLDGKQSKMEGPLSDLSQTVNKVKSLLAGNLGTGQQIIKELNAYAAGIVPTGTIDRFLIDVDSGLTRLQKGLGENYGAGMDALKQLKGFSPKELGEAIAPQIEKMVESGIAKAVPQLQEIIGAAGTVTEILEGAQKLFPELKRGTAELETLLKGLAHDPAMQLQAILANVAEDGFSAIANVAGLDLHLHLDKLLATIDKSVPEPTAPPGTPAYKVQQQTNLKTYLAELKESLPPTMKEGLSDVALLAIAKPDTLPPAISATELAKLDQSLIASPIGLTSSNTLDSLFAASPTAPTGADPISLTPNPSLDSLLAPATPSAPISPPTPPIIPADTIASLTGTEKVENLVGIAAANSTQKAEEQLKPAKDLVESIERLRALGRALKNVSRGADFAKALKDLKGTPFGKLVNLEHEKLFDHAAKEVLPKAIALLEKELAPILQKALAMINQLINMIPKQQQGAVVSALQQVATIIADPAKKGGIAEFSRTKAEILGPKNGTAPRTSVFAGQKAAGLASEFGKMALGSDGGAMSTLGNLAMRSLQPDGASAGVLMDKAGASLSSFFPTDKATNHDAKPADWGNPSASIGASGQSAIMQANAPQGTVLNQIAVKPEGIFMNEVNVKVLIDLIPQLATLAAQVATLSDRLAALETAPPPSPATPTTP